MTLEQIKNEITASLKEVRESSRDFSGCESYDDLQSLFKKAIGRVALCESAEDIEAVGDLLMAIEELYNDCNSELLEQPSETELFSFDFELDDESNSSYDETKEEADDEDEFSEGENDNTDEKRSQKNPVAKKKSEPKEKEQTEERVSTKRNYSDVKSAFDQKYPVAKLRKPNIMRLCVGCIALLSGIGIGLVDALWWPWEWYAWAVIGVGLSYLILSAIYAIAIATRSKKAVRVMAVTRLILTFVMIAVSIILGLLLPYDLTVGGAFIATLPFTFFGMLTYLIYRIRLAFSDKAGKKAKKK